MQVEEYISKTGAKAMHTRTKLITYIGLLSHVKTEEPFEFEFPFFGACTPQANAALSPVVQFIQNEKQPLKYKQYLTIYRSF